MAICADFLEEDISFPARFASVEQSFPIKFEGTFLVQGPPGPAGPQGETGASCYVRINPETMMWETATVSEGEEAIWVSSGIGAVGPAGITPHIGANGNWFIGDTDTGAPSRGADGVPGKPGETGPVGPQGPAGAPGTNGTSVTHSWDGTVLTITSASGTSSADLKGEDGDTAMLEPLTVTVSMDDNLSMTANHTGEEILAALTEGRQVGLLFSGMLLNFMGVYDGEITFCPLLYGSQMILIYVDSATNAVGWHTNEYLNADELNGAIDTALAQAKASGEFDGEDGADGITPHIGANGNWFIGNTDTGKPSRGADGKDGAQGEQGIQGEKGEKGDTGAQGAKGDKGDTGAQGIQGDKGATGEKGDKGDKGDTGATGASGKDGADGVSPTVSVSKSGKVTTVSITDAIGTKTATINDGSDGKDGTSVTHSWSGTTLSVTSASGTSSANLKGEKGDKGDSVKGDKGDTGVGISSVKQTTTSTADDGNNVITVTLTNGTTSTFTVQNGSKGSSGSNGKDGADGKTPVKGTDYFTAADKTEMVNDVLAALPTWTGGSY